jgi:Zn-dependent peptidase ImmA (M78 family)
MIWRVAPDTIDHCKECIWREVEIMSATATAELLRSPRWNLARRKADELTQRYTVPPIPVVEIAEGNGVNVVFAAFGKHSDTIAGFCDFNERQIVVNDDDNVGRKMFTIAHEFGHWILHKQFFESDPDSYAVLPRFRRPAQNPFEQEANCFAAELLVPKHLLAPIRSAGIAKLAEIFGVSREMMEFRLKNV